MQPDRRGSQGIRRSGRESTSEKKSLSLFSQEDGRCSESALGENKSQEVSDLADNHSVCSQGQVMSAIALLRQRPNPTTLLPRTPDALK